MNDGWKITLIGVICIVLSSITCFYFGMNEGKKRAYIDVANVTAMFPIDTGNLILGNLIASNDTVTQNDWLMQQDITIKYLDDVGLVVKWIDGVAVTDNGSIPVKWIQRFEPWLNERTDIDYCVTWEE